MRVAGVELQGLVAFLKDSSGSILGRFQGVFFVESILGWVSDCGVQQKRLLIF